MSGSWGHKITCESLGCSRAGGGRVSAMLSVLQQLQDKMLVDGDEHKS